MTAGYSVAWGAEDFVAGDTEDFVAGGTEYFGGAL